MTADAAARIDTLIEVRRFEEATGVARAALAEAPSDPELLLRLARLDGLAGRWDDEIAHAEAAMRVEPQREWAHRMRAQGLLGKGWLADAELAARACSRLRPEEPLAYLPLLDVLTAMGEHDRGLAVLAQALEVGPGHHLVLYRGARLHKERGELGQALEMGRRALEIRPEWGDLHVLLGDILQEEGDVDAAAEHYVAAGKADPRDQRPRSRLRRLVGYGAVGVGALAFGMTYAVRGGLKEGLRGYEDLGLEGIGGILVFALLMVVAIVFGLFIAYKFVVPFTLWAVRPLIRRAALRRARKLPPEARRVIGADLESEKKRRR